MGEVLFSSNNIKISFKLIMFLTHCFIFVFWILVLLCNWLNKIVHKSVLFAFIIVNFKNLFSLLLNWFLLKDKKNKRNNEFKISINLWAKYLKIDSPIRKLLNPYFFRLERLLIQSPLVSVLIGRIGIQMNQSGKVFLNI